MSRKFIYATAESMNPLKIFTLLTLLFFISACTPEQETPLRIGTNVWPGYEPLYLARSLGYYHKTPIKLVEMGSASDVLHALRDGTLEGAALTLDETLSLMDDGFDLRVILVMDFSEGGDVLLAKPYIKSLADLRGKRVAVEYNAVGAVLLDGALRAGGLNASDIKIIACPQSRQLECYKKADAVVTFEPMKTKLLELGAKQLFDSSRIKGRIVDVLVVLADAVNSHRHSLKQLVAGYFKARDYLKTHPEDATKRISARMHLTPDSLLRAYRGLKLPGLDENRTLLSGEPAPLEITAGKLNEFMRNIKLLKNWFPVDGLVDNSFLPDANMK